MALTGNRTHCIEHLEGKAGVEGTNTPSKNGKSGKPAPTPGTER